MNPLQPLLTGLFGLLQRLGNRRDLDQFKRDQALMHIMTAANQTRGYLEATARGKKRDLEREHALSNLWNICGVAIREFDKDLSRRCDLKAEYWRNPQEWSVEAVHEARIGLGLVAKEAEYLLRLKVRPAKRTQADR
jgi:hypothetical protein